MTDQERKVLEEAEQQAFETSQELYDPNTSGIRPPPRIEETITELEGNLFGLEFEKFPEAEVQPIEEEGGGVCPLLSVTFSSVTFECFCGQVGGFDSVRLYEVDFNGRLFDLGAPDTGFPPVSCLYDPNSLGDAVGDINYATTDCSGGETSRSPVSEVIIAGLSGGIFYLSVTAGGAGVTGGEFKTVFKGSATMTGFPLTITNDLSCGDTGNFDDDPVFVALFGTGRTYIAMAGGGSAVVS